MSLGRHHPLVKRLRRLRRDPAARASEGVFLAEGPRLARVALDCGADVERVVLSPALATRPGGAELRRRIEAAGWTVDEVAEGLLDSLQDARSPQPLVCVARRREGDLERALGGAAPLIAVAHGVQDPGNLGGIQRTALAAGAAAFVVCGGGADPYHPRAVRASAGAAFRLPASTPAWNALRERLAARGIPLLGATADSSTPYTDCDLSGSVALVFGSEGSGLPTAVAVELDGTVGIPMAPGVESLSVGAAAAILLFEAARRRAGRTVEPGNRNG